MNIDYEWCIEDVVVDDVHGDEIVDHWHAPNFVALMRIKDELITAPGIHNDQRLDVVLVRTKADVCGDRSWAYIEDDGELPEHFSDSDGKEVYAVPKRFIHEVRRYYRLHPSAKAKK